MFSQDGRPDDLENVGRTPNPSGNLVPTGTTTSGSLGVPGGPHWGFYHPSIGEGGWRAWFEPYWVYVIASGADEQPVKIGITGNVQQRIKSFEAGNPYGLRAASVHRLGRGLARQVERRLHVLFADHALGREWFRVSAEDAALPIPVLCAQADEALEAFKAEILRDPVTAQQAADAQKRIADTKASFARAMLISQRDRRARLEREGRRA